ncbi:MAG: ROK family protein [Burkholderiaceae bacterium]
MRIGIDLGGTKIEILAIDDCGRELHRERVATPAGDYAATIASVAGLVQRCEQTLGARATVGVAIPGSRSPATGLIRNANSVVLNGRDLGADLTRALGRETRLANDANCFAISEATDGAAAGAASVFGVILGTGCGGALVVNGRILDGANGIAGEWGHNRLAAAAADEFPGPACWCSRHGCLETWLSGPGLLADHRRRGGHAPDARAVVEAMRAGDPLARETLRSWADRLARGLAMVINIFDPEVIVLGGGLSQIDEVYHWVPGLWGAHVFADRIETRLLRNRHGDSSGVRGAAWLWPLPA